MSSQQRDTVLIIDDKLQRRVKDSRGYPTYNRSADLEEAKSIANTVDQPVYNLSDEYDGEKRLEVLVSSEPKLATGKDLSYKSDHPMELAHLGMDYERALDIVDDVQPDSILLDMNMGSWAPKQVFNEYGKAIRSSKDLFRVQPEKPKFGFWFGRRDITSLYDQHGERRRTWTESSLNAHGGVSLGYMLERQGQDFTFWTAEFAHGTEAIKSAYAIDLLDSVDVVDLTVDTCRGEYGSLSKSRKGNIVVGNKEVSSINPTVYYDGLNGSALDEVLNAADTYDGGSQSRADWKRSFPAERGVERDIGLENQIELYFQYPPLDDPELIEEP